MNAHHAANHAQPRPATASIAGVLVQQVLALPRAQLRAALIVLHDAVERSYPMEDGSAVTERCAGYWVPDGTLSRAVAQLVFPFAYDALGARQVRAQRVRALGYPVRRVAEGGGRGAYWHLPARGLEAGRDALAALRLLGHEPEAHRTCYVLGAPVAMPVVQRGRRAFLCCPEHQDDDPSALVNPSGAVWCFACARVVGIAAWGDGDTVQYRRVLGVRATHEAPPARAQRPPPAPGGVVQPVPTGAPHRGFLSAPPVSAFTRPYSVGACLRAGDPGPPPCRPQGRRPTGIVVREPGATSHVPPQPLGLVLGRRYEDQPAGRHRPGRYGLARTYSGCMDLLGVLRVAHRQHAGERAMDRALGGLAEAEHRGTDPRRYLPDLYASLDHHEHEAVREVAARGARGVVILQPTAFSAACTAWVGVDVDGVDRWPAEEDAVAAAVQVQTMLERHPVFSGRMGLVRTSSMGAQLVMQLEAARWSPAGFYGDPHVQQMLANLDAACLRILREHGMQGGHADPSVHAPGRMVRRPGPRADKAGNPAVARLVWATA